MSGAGNRKIASFRITFTKRFLHFEISRKQTDFFFLKIAEKTDAAKDLGIT